MVKINKIYTKNGDEGTTHLVGGKRIAKASDRIDTVGDIDELNAHMGVIRTLLEQTRYIPKHIEIIAKIQNDLFDIGSIIATPSGESFSGMRTIESNDIIFLEQSIDYFTESLRELTSFVLPGGTIINANLHIARAVCRRVERKLWKLNETERISKELLIYINRLSDLCFAFSRYDVCKTDKKEYLWVLD